MIFLLGNCSYWYDQHPFQADCNPLGVDVVMRCIVYVPVNSSAELRWYWTPEEEDAGMCGTLITGEEDNYNTEDKTFTGKNAYAGLIGTQSDLRVFDFNLQDIGYYWCQIEDGDVQLAPSKVGNLSDNSYSACNTIVKFLPASICAELPSLTVVSCVSSTYTSPQAPYATTVSGSSSDTFSYTLTAMDILPSRTPTASLPPPPQGDSQLLLYVGIGLGVFGALVLAVACALMVFGVIYVVRRHSPKGSRDKQKVKVEGEFRTCMLIMT